MSAASDSRTSSSSSTTDTVGAWNMSVSIHRQRETKRDALALVRGDPQPAAVIFDDRTANRQTNPDAVRLGSDLRVKPRKRRIISAARPVLVAIRSIHDSSFSSRSAVLVWMA